jgi:short-subunit dehydrogenase
LNLRIITTAITTTAVTMGSVSQEPEPERILKTDLREYSKRTRTDGPYADDLDIDVLIVGAGFGGMHFVKV